MLHWPRVTARSLAFTEAVALILGINQYLGTSIPVTAVLDSRRPSDSPFWSEGLELIFAWEGDTVMPAESSAHIRQCVGAQTAGRSPLLFLQWLWGTAASHPWPSGVFLDPSCPWVTIPGQGTLILGSSSREYRSGGADPEVTGKARPLAYVREACPS